MASKNDRVEEKDKPARHMMQLPAMTAFILYYSVMAAFLENNDDIGHGDCVRTYEDMTKALSKGVLNIRSDVVESGLWAANMLHEAGRFEHPLKKTYENFLEYDVLRGLWKYDPQYNILTRKW